MGNDPTLIGFVQDVSGATISVVLDEHVSDGILFIKGHGYRIGQVGSFIKIPMGYIDLFGIVSQVGASAIPDKLLHTEMASLQWMTVQLVGEGHRNGQFQRGLSQYPTIGDKAHLVTEEDLACIYGHPDEPNYIAVGHLASAESIPALIDVDKLLTRHSAIVGATGAGKSTTVAGLLRTLSDDSLFSSSRILVLDIHGEYYSALKDRANIFRINANQVKGEKPLFIPYWAMTFDELLSVTFGALDDASRGAVLEKITQLKSIALKDTPREGIDETNLTVDSPIPFSIHKLWFDFYRLVNARHIVPPGPAQNEQTEALLTDKDGYPVQMGDALKVIPPIYMQQTQAANSTKIYLSGSTLNIRRQLEGLASRLRDPRFDFLFRPGPWATDEYGKPQADLDSLLSGWLGNEKPITILDLSGVPVSILNNLVGVLLRVIYDALFWARDISEGGRSRPLLIVLEEAHAYLNQSDASQAALAVRRIVKEGRKYGIGAMIVSQRPSEIDTTILSQCGTIFAMRLTNANDRSHISSAVSDNLEGLIKMLPILRTGEAIIVGEAVHLPIRTLIKLPPPNQRPDSQDPVVYDSDGPGGWNRGKEPSDYGEVVAIWRKQNPRSPRIIDKKEA
jgi:hypothetical protein